MPDISLCLDDSCPVRQNCYCFRAIPSEYWQSMFSERPWDHANMKCEHRWMLTQGDRTRPLKECDEAAKEWWERMKSKSRAKRVATQEGFKDGK